MSDPNRRLEGDLAFLRDSCIAAVRESRLGVLQDGLDVYYDLVRTFLDELGVAGVKYDRDVAIRELSSLTDSWLEMEWLESAYRAILDAAIDTGKVAVIDDALYFPIRVASLAMQESDYYVFHRFLKWLPYTYARLSSVPSKEARSFIVDRCGRYLQEAVSFLIAPFFRERGSADVRLLGDYIIGIESVFGELLKESIDRRRPKHYCHFSSQLRQGIKFMKYSLPDLGSVAYGEPPSPTGRDSGSDDPEGIRAIQETYDRVLKNAHLVSLGSLAWVTHLFEADRVNAKKWRRFRDCADLPDDASTLWTLYLDARVRDAGANLGWNRWELEEHPEGEAHLLAFDSYLSLALTVLLLDGALDLGTVLNVSPDSAFLVGAEGEIMGSVSLIEQDADRWRALIGDDLDDRLASLKTILTESASRERAAAANRIIIASIAPNRLNQVAENVLHGWRATAHFRELCERAGVWERSNTAAPDDMISFGLKNWDLKEIYAQIEESELHTEGWGEEYGRSLGRGEDDEVIRTLEPLRAGALYLEPGRMTAEIDEWLDAESADRSYPAIVIVGSWIAFQTVTVASGFKRRSGVTGSSGVIGTYRSAPVANLHSSVWTGLLMLDVSRALRWTQFDPPPAPEGLTVLIEDQIAFNVRTFDYPAALKLTEENENLRRWRNQLLSPEDAALELAQRAHVSILEAFRVTMVEADGARSLILPD